MADMQQLEQALRNADAAGDAAAARKLASAIMAMRQSTSRPMAASPTPPQVEGDSIGRQAGLFARSTLSGIAGIPQMVTEPARQMLINPAMRAMGWPTARPLTGEADKLSDWMGLPAPRNGAERIVGKGVEMGMGATGMASAATKLGGLVSGVPKTVLEMMGANQGTQAFAGASGGMAGEQAKENGGGWGAQLASSVIGGLGGAGIAAAGKGITNAASNFFRPTLTPQVIDQRVTQILVQQGVDPASIGPAMLSKMREDVTKALKMGGTLDDNSVARLADYSRTGTTPTRAGVTLDPYDVTVQRNAEKMGAAMGDRSARLPQNRSLNNLPGSQLPAPLVHPWATSPGGCAVPMVASRCLQRVRRSGMPVWSISSGSKQTR